MNKEKMQEYIDACVNTLLIEGRAYLDYAKIEGPRERGRGAIIHPDRRGQSDGSINWSFRCGDTGSILDTKMWHIKACLSCEFELKYEDYNEKLTKADIKAMQKGVADKLSNLEVELLANITKHHNGSRDNKAGQLLDVCFFIEEIASQLDKVSEFYTILPDEESHSDASEQ